MTRNNQHRVDPAVKRAARLQLLARVARMVAVVVVTAGAAQGVVWLNGTLSVSEWNVTAPESIRHEIESRLQAMDQRDFLSTRPELLRQRWLEQIPDMEEVQISRVLPHRLQVTAIARTPEALWQDEQDRVHLLDSHGYAYRLLARGESPDLPLLRVREEQLPAAHRLLAVLSRDSAERLAALSEIHAGGNHWKLYFARGAAWLLPQKQEEKYITAVAAQLAQPRWRTGQWSVDARIQSRWFIRPAGHEGVI
ncbi:hypothetical protein FE236_04810 [Mariprofundus erugo]|uniref:Cell division protein FtsQ/DivIB C-terminal domain-containing protein n=1 Tax=Mariprofundus erugo TaxID=2528639 RepID=A0A5R9GRS3_9PROT|nr:cell division protein FtsQ/DivIB [Mariprofundus erugo]TLS68258.1 hypothetical protein FEF65_04495 [Mariprofundus erugo]TLS77114.1 hypothetical protein FE236_04810 [Mariprofundus erugo]